ncbi:MAG: hypothetical protein H6R15_571 [Proteobacteria bacterium]|nr:hypothetical protein [Pseudomonadota bacterium]
MLLTALAAWLIAAQSKRRREIGFWCFLLSNGLWMLWGWHDKAYALMFLQVVLAGLNIRGYRRGGASRREFQKHQSG